MVIAESTPLARVPNQLVSDDSEEINEFAAAGGGGNSLGSGNIMGYSGGLGAGSSKKKRKAKKKKK
jgi:hypothetical protein